jgi:hypothetical protein
MLWTEQGLMNAWMDVEMVLVQDKNCSPNYNEEAVIVPSYDVLNGFTAFDNRLGSGQCSTDQISPEWEKSV